MCAISIYLSHMELCSALVAGTRFVSRYASVYNSDRHISIVFGQGSVGWINLCLQTGDEQSLQIERPH